MTGDIPPEKQECALCGEELVKRDSIIRLSLRTKGVGIDNIVDYHSSCFMDIVNVDKDRPHDDWQAISRTEIMNGKLKKNRVERAVIRPNPE